MLEYVSNIRGAVHKSGVFVVFQDKKDRTYKHDLDNPLL